MSIIFNGVGLLLTDSKVILSKITENGDVNKLSTVVTFKFSEPISPTSSEILLISAFEEFFEQYEEYCSFPFRLMISQKFINYFSFPLETTLSPKEINKQIAWEFSHLFPGNDFEKVYSTYFVTNFNEQKFVNVFLFNKKISDAIFKFSTRRKIKIDFFEHPAIASFNACKLTNDNFNFLTYSACGFTTIIYSSNKNINGINFFKTDNENLKNQITEFIERSGIKNPRFLLTGTESKLIEDKLNSIQDIEILKPNFSEFIDPEESEKIEDGFFPSLIGLLSRVK